MPCRKADCRICIGFARWKIILEFKRKLYFSRMSELIINASSLIQRLSHLLSGTYRSSNEEYTAMRQDMLSRFTLF